MLEIKIDDSQVIAKLRQLQTKLVNLKNPMADIGEKLVETTKRRFAEGHGPNGEAWAANKESTIMKMLGRTKGNFKKDGSRSAKGSRRVGGKKPLVGSGTLSGSIHYKAHSNELEIGSGIIYARVQHYGAGKGAFGNMRNGSPIPWGDIPARPYLGFSDEDRSIILETIDSYLKA